MKEQISLGQTLAAELEREAAATRKMLERLPAERFGWKPHEKSMPSGTLAVHIAEMIDWVRLAVTTTELDYSLTPYKPFKPRTNSELLEYFDGAVAGALAGLNQISDEDIAGTWTVRDGKRVYFQKPRLKVIRGDCFNHF